MIGMLSGLRSVAKARGSLGTLLQTGLQESKILGAHRLHHNPNDDDANNADLHHHSNSSRSSWSSRMQQMGHSTSSTSTVSLSHSSHNPLGSERHHHSHSQCLTLQNPHQPSALRYTVSQPHVLGDQQRSFSSSSTSTREPVQQPGSNDAKGDGRIVLYKGKGIKVFRILVRMKIAQLTAIAAAAIPIATYSVEGAVPLVQLVASGALLFGAGVVSTAVWYYSSRYVGELAAVRGREDYVVFSTMDFWGRRQDDVRHVLDVEPPLNKLSPAAIKVLAERSLLPVNVSGDRQYFVSLRHGELKDTRRLMELMDGSWRRQAMARQEEEAAAAAAAAKAAGGGRAVIGSLGGHSRTCSK